MGERLNEGGEVVSPTWRGVGCRGWWRKEEKRKEENKRFNKIIIL